MKNMRVWKSSELKRDHVHKQRWKLEFGKEEEAKSTDL